MQTAALNTRFSAVKIYVKGNSQKEADDVTAIGVTTPLYDARKELETDGAYFVTSSEKVLPYKGPPEKEGVLTRSNLIPGVLSDWFNCKVPSSQELTPAEVILSTYSDTMMKLDKEVLEAFESILLGFRLILMAVYDIKPSNALRQSIKECQKQGLEKAITAKKITFDQKGGEIKFDLKA